MTWQKFSKLYSRKYWRELNLAVDEINCVPLNYIPTFNAYIKNSKRLHFNIEACFSIVSCGQTLARARALSFAAPLRELWFNELMNLKGRLHQSRLVFSSALSNIDMNNIYIQYNNKIHNKHNTTIGSGHARLIARLL